jgi:hypothetical protein
VVIDAGRVVGIFTEIDVLRHICGRFRNPKLHIVVSYPSGQPAN